MAFEHLIFEKRGNIAVLSINRPDALNSLNSKVLDEFSDALDMIVEDAEVHVLIVTGVGRSFVAGADIAEMKNLNPEGARALDRKSVV